MDRVSLQTRMILFPDLDDALAVNGDNALRFARDCWSS